MEPNGILTLKPTAKARLVQIKIYANKLFVI
jgi:hypothetical protein